MKRITDNDLSCLCARINELLGTPPERYVQLEPGQPWKANVGTYYVDHAYGGVSLYRIENEHGGVSSVFGLGHVPKRELFDQMCAFIEGVRAGRGA